MGVPAIEWAALFKNLRGVVLLSQAPDRDKVRWLARKHRYRRLGLPSRSPAVPQVPELGRAPFVPLRFPVSDLNPLPELLSHRAPAPVVESLLLSCCYSAPLIVLDENLFRDLEPFMTWRLLSSEPLGEKDLIFHLRVASYVIIDFFELAREAFEALREYLQSPQKGFRKLDRLCDTRREKARRDGEKRFWRIPSGVGGRVICVYLDPLPVICDELKRENKRLAQLLMNSDWAGLCLPITCAFGL